MKISKNIVVALLLICIISFGFKIYFVDFTIPVQFDNFDYTLRGIAHSQGDFSQDPKKMSGWPIFASAFFFLVDSDNFLDYSNTLLLLGMSVSTLTIIPMYALSRKFFDQKYSVVAASLFAFQPHLNYNASFGFSEPLYILMIILSFFFIIQNKEKFSYVSFAFAGFAWWIRIEGLIIFFAVSIIFLINFKKISWHFPKYGLCLIVFLLVISPILIMRDIQYEDPLYFYWTNISNYDDYYFADISEGSTASNYIDETETSDFIFNFLTSGIYNVFFNISRILFPYLILLFPFGILFSLRPVKQESNLIKANWVFIATSIGFLILLLAIIPERRYLFFLFPFFIIFSVIPIQRLVDNGLSTFSFSQKQKKIVLLGIICIVILLSGLFSLRFEKLDSEEEKEKIEFAKFLVHNLDGNILGGTESRHIDFIKLTETSGGFKNYKIDKSKEPGEGFPYTTGNRLYILKGETIDDLLLYGNDNNIKFLIVKESNSNYEFLDDIYSNSEEYLFLERVFDSEIENYTKLKLKVFEIKYENYFPLK